MCPVVLGGRVGERTEPGARVSPEKPARSCGHAVHPERAAVPVGPEHRHPADPTVPVPPMAAWAGPTVPREPVPAPCSWTTGCFPPGQHTGLRAASEEPILQGAWPLLSRDPRPCLLGPCGPAFPPGQRGAERLWWRPCSLPVCTFFSPAAWLYLAGSSLPCLTLIGSPTFGYRSVHRDLEAQIAIVTESRAPAAASFTRLAGAMRWWGQTAVVPGSWGAASCWGPKGGKEPGSPSSDAAGRSLRREAYCTLCLHLGLPFPGGCSPSHIGGMVFPLRGQRTLCSHRM